LGVWHGAAPGKSTLHPIKRHPTDDDFTTSDGAMTRKYFKLHLKRPAISRKDIASSREAGPTRWEPSG
jgi:hypothetical protein